MSAMRNFILGCFIVVYSCSLSFASELISKSDKEYIQMNAYLSKVVDNTLGREVKRFYINAWNTSKNSDQSRYIKNLENSYKNIINITSGIINTKIPHNFAMSDFWNALTKQCYKLRFYADDSIKNLSKISVIENHQDQSQRIISDFDYLVHLKEYINDKISGTVFGVVEKKSISSTDKILEDYSNFDISDGEKIFSERYKIISNLRNAKEVSSVVSYLQEIYSSKITYQEYKSHPQFNIVINQLSFTKLFETNESGFVLFFIGNNKEPSFVLKDNKVWIISKIDYKNYDDDCLFVINAWDIENIFLCLYMKIGENEDEKEKLSYRAYHIRSFKGLDDSIRNLITKASIYK